MSDNVYTKTQRILARNEYASNDTWATGLNNNDLIIGPTGSGKTRYYVKPNLLQCNESVIVTDTKGSLVREVGPVLEARGYCIEHIDFTDVTAGTGYNPLDFIRVNPETGAICEQDILRIARALCPIENQIEPFWDYAAQMYIGALIGYVMEFLPESEHTLEYVLKLAAGMNTPAEPKKDEKERKSVTERLFEEARVQAPDSFAAQKWASFSVTIKADKMNASILGIVAEKLDTLAFGDTYQMFSKEQRIDFRSLGERKTALFLTVSDTDASMYRLVSLLYTQALQALCQFADKSEGSALPVPVRLYLDDFATNCRIDGFDKIISVIRSRNIAVSVVLQSLTQLESLYTRAEALTIANGCDHWLYLGGQDIETAGIVSRRVNKTLDTVLNQPVDRMWLLRRGHRGKTVQRYLLSEHELYPELPEAKAINSADVSLAADNAGANEAMEPLL